MKTNSFSQSLFFLVGIPIVLIHGGVPEARALQKQAPPRNPAGQRRAVAVKQSSRPLFSPLQPFQKELQQQQQSPPLPPLQQDVEYNKPSMIETFKSTIQTPPILASLDKRMVLSTAATGVLALLAIHSLLRTGRLAAIARHVNWWVQNAFFTYQNSLVNHPLSTKVGTGAVLAILGDALAQSTTAGDRGGRYDKRRALSFACFDSCYRVFQHNMFPFVIALCKGNVFRAVLPWVVPSVSAAVERTLLYQLVVVPVSQFSISLDL
jgi:hypothetical protein